MSPVREGSMPDRIPAALTDAFLRRPVAAAHPCVAATVQPSATARQIAELMEESGCREVVVCSPFSARPVGIITQRDLTRNDSVVGAAFAKRTAREIMTPRPFCLGPHASIGLALNKMATEGWDGVPIVDEFGRLSGVLTITHVMRILFRLAQSVASPREHLSIQGALAERPAQVQT